MNKFWLLVLPLTLLLTACGVEEDEEEVEDIRLMHRNTDDVENGTVDSSKRYDFVLTADDTSYTLSGDLNDIKITGDRNTITFGEDLVFDKLVITGTNNRVNSPESGSPEFTGTANTIIVTAANNTYSGVTSQNEPVVSVTVTTTE